jgi:hypothetical protein
VASLMTGLHPQTHGAGVRYGEFAPTGLTGGVRTLAETLRDAGFYNLGVYHNIYVNPAFGLQQGFDEYVSIEDRAAPLVDRALEGSAAPRTTAASSSISICSIVHNPVRAAGGGVPDRGAPPPAGLPGTPGLQRRPPAGAADSAAGGPALARGALRRRDRLHRPADGPLPGGLEDLGLDDDTVVLVVSDHGEEFWTRLDRERALGYEANSDHGHTVLRGAAPRAGAPPRARERKSGGGGEPGRAGRDLSAARPDLVAALRAAGERELEERRKARARFVAGDGAQSATYLEWNHITRLRSLGYLK